MGILSKQIVMAKRATTPRVAGAGGGGGMKRLGLSGFRSSQEGPCKLGFRSLGVAWEDPGQLPVVVSLECNEAIGGMGLSWIKARN